MKTKAGQVQLRAEADVAPRGLAFSHAGEPVRPTVVLTYGLPGSGKSTEAAKLVSIGYRRLSLDDLRGMLGGKFTPTIEAAARAGIVTMAEQLVKAKHSVVLDNTHVGMKLPLAVKERLSSYVVRWGVIDLMDVPTTTCIARDTKRKSGRVGADAIWKMDTAVSYVGRYLTPRWLAPDRSVQPSGKAWTRSTLSQQSRTELSMIANYRGVDLPPHLPTKVLIDRILVVAGPER